MTHWTIHPPTKEFPFRYAVKKYDGNITTRAGKQLNLPAGSVMVDDKKDRPEFSFEKDGTIFFPHEWEAFVQFGYDMQLYRMKRVFDVDISVKRKYNK